MKFPSAVSKQLKYYVYLYLDPETDEVFYVGKGKGNRAFYHLEEEGESEKVRRIREIRKRGREPKVEILIHGLKDDQTAKRVEAAVIDLLGMDALTNNVRGWRSGVHGRMGIDELIGLYREQKAKITEPGLLIRINMLYRYGMSDQELYDATRGVWRVGEPRKEVEYAFAVYEGIIKEVYKVEQWFPAGTTFSSRKEEEEFPDRWEFVGNIAEDTIRKKYLNKSVRHLYSKGARNPIAYINV